MSKSRTSITLDPMVLEKIDKTRGYESRSSFVNRKMSEILSQEK
jgi:metal-responsive CopG/Arc/MetJ family transcriptional regulator